MTISEMHVYFRQYAQQMGMQNVRAILPEQIDILINTSISDTVNQIVKENIGITSDRVITDNSKLGSINALRSLYKVLYKNVCDTDTSKQGFFSKGDNDGHMVHLRTDIERISNSNLYVNGKANFIFLLDFSINYKREDFVTNFFPVRIIDDACLADVLNDFILCPRFRSPIITIYKDEFDSENTDIQEFNLYIDRGEVSSVDEYDSVKATLDNGLIPNQFRISYLGKPNKVAFNDDNEGTSVDCDLPAYLHVDIVKHAVDLYHLALQGSLYANQQAQQQQQMENARNNVQQNNQ